MDRAILQKWLKSGYMEKHVLHETTDGTPKVELSPPRSLTARWMDLNDSCRKNTQQENVSSPLEVRSLAVNLIRYADDFVITSKSKELLEGEIKPLVEQFLQERGLELSPTKTVITHVEQGFDFLGQNVRRYPNGKLLIKPSKKNVKTFLEGIRRIDQSRTWRVCRRLDRSTQPKDSGLGQLSSARGEQTHVRIASITPSSHSLWQWARRRHPNKSPTLAQTEILWAQLGDRDWSFFGETCDDEGQPNKVWLYYAK